MNLNHSLFLLEVIILVSASNMILRKCCHRGESLNRLSLCSNETDNNSTSDWIPVDPFIIHSSKSTVKISKERVLETVKKLYSGGMDYGFPSCERSRRDIAISWKDPEIEDQFYLILDDDKKVKLNLNRESVFHDNIKLSFSKTFPPETYCIDNGPSESYVAIVCPCETITCIRKCCQQDMVFEEDTKRCVSIDALNMSDSNYDEYKNWRPQFEVTEFDFDEEPNVEYFLLSGKFPTCTGDRGVHIQKNDEKKPFYFDNDGNVKVMLTDGTTVVLPPGEHCGDLGWKDGRLSPLLLRCYSQRSSAVHKQAVQRAGAYGTLLGLAALLLGLAAAAIATCGGLEERSIAKTQFAHVASLAVAHFAAAISQFLPPGDRSPFCIFTGKCMHH